MYNFHADLWYLNEEMGGEMGGNGEEMGRISVFPNAATQVSTNF